MLPIRIALLGRPPAVSAGMCRYISQALPFVEEVVEAAELPELQALCRPARARHAAARPGQMPNVDGTEAARQLLAGVSRPAHHRALHVFGRQVHHPDDEAARAALPAQRRGPGPAAPHPGGGAAARATAARRAFRGLPIRGVQHPRARLTTPRASPTWCSSPTREHEVLQPHLPGLHRAAEIAEQLFISRRTAEGHRQKLLEKHRRAPTPPAWSCTPCATVLLR
ncbi:MAG: hypothetical protein WKG07_22160 [Hymenobacter sp.]